MQFRKLRACAAVAFAIVSMSGAGRAQEVDQVPGKTITLTLDGALGPVISGDDPAGLDGQSATVTVTVKESLDPYKTTATSASYHIPAGDVMLTVNGTNYTSTTRSSMTVKLGKTADLLTLKGNVTVLGQQVKISDVSALQSGSWDSGVLQHPELFSPSPQDLSEPASTFTYTAFGEKTVLGVTGTAANSD